MIVFSCFWGLCASLIRSSLSNPVTELEEYRNVIPHLFDLEYCHINSKIRFKSQNWAFRGNFKFSQRTHFHAPTKQTN